MVSPSILTGRRDASSPVNDYHNQNDVEFHEIAAYHKGFRASLMPMREKK